MMRLIESRDGNIIGFQANTNYQKSEKDGRHNKTANGD